ncbi:hypothetical protein tloyanaT_35370 [Thalassotalea loyana]|uniref:Uncharacterized protein n=1 Tax=Thalassotalea loyana TaxID=280483 RepID=A0ABQ6HH56_9GAMM|nr:hypothetical protein [Thalassotalea loyana]GLX87284.1 hypothetical protein tloyanaT_35370 [Thalassotalea loyana]
MDISGFEKQQIDSRSAGDKMRFGRANHTTFLNIRDYAIRDVSIDNVDEVINDEEANYILGYN